MDYKSLAGVESGLFGTSFGLFRRGFDTTGIRSVCSCMCTASCAVTGEEMVVAFKTKRKRGPRAKGEGSIFQRKDGMWVGSVETGYDADGKRKQKRVYATTQAALVDKLNELKADLTDGIQVNRIMTVEHWLNYWLPHIHKERVRPTTYLDYEWTVRNITRTIGRRRLVDLEAKHIREMHQLIGKGERRAQKAHVLLHRALTDAVAEGLLRRNIADAVDPPEVYKGERKPFTIEQTHQILTLAGDRNEMEYARWLMAFTTGARQGECLGLTWDRVKLNAVDITWQLQQWKRAHGCGNRQSDGTWPCGRKHGARCTKPLFDVPVKTQYQPLADSLVLSRPKSESGKRWVPVIQPLREAFTALKEKDCGPNPHNLVFHRADGYPITPTEDNRAWNRLLDEAGIEREGRALTLHSARRTAATELRSGGVDEQTRMELLGHNSPEVTRIYAHEDQAMKSTAMDALLKLVPPKALS